MSRQLHSCLRGATAIFGFILASGCSTPTTMTDVWKDPSYSAAPLRSLVVFGGRMDDANRHVLEDGFVSALAKHGVRAVASYTLFPALPAEDAARKAMREAGVDGYLVAALKGTTERTSLVPGVYTAEFWGGYYGGWGGAWNNGPWFPGYVVTDEFVKFETSLWDGRIGGGKLVWSATTQTENPSSGKDFTRSLLKDVIPALTQAGLLPPEQGRNVSYAVSVPAL